MRRLAFSLIEVLVAISIIALLAALAFPALNAAKGRARIETCLSNMKQTHLAIKLYQQDYDGEGIYGDMYAMGLPDHYHDLPLQRWYCDGIPNEVFSSQSNGPYMYVPVPPEFDRRKPTWAEYSIAEQDNAMLIYDINHNPKDIPLTFGKKFVKFGIGVRLSGQAVRVRRTGLWYRMEWWH